MADVADPTETEGINALRAAKLAYDRTGGERLLRDAVGSARGVMSHEQIAAELGMTREEVAAIVPD